MSDADLEYVRRILSDWEQVKLDRATAADCLAHTGPGESPYSQEALKVWNDRERELSIQLLIIMPIIESLLRRLF